MPFKAEAINSFGELSLSSDSPALVVNPRLTAIINHAERRTYLGRYKNLYMWDIGVNNFNYYGPYGPQPREQNMVLAFQGSQYASIQWSGTYVIRVVSPDSNLFSTDFMLLALQNINDYSFVVSNSMASFESATYIEREIPLNQELPTLRMYAADNSRAFNSYWTNVYDSTTVGLYDMLPTNNSDTKSTVATFPGNLDGGSAWILSSAPLAVYTHNTSRWAWGIGYVRTHRYLAVMRTSFSPVDNQLTVTTAWTYKYEEAESWVTTTGIGDWEHAHFWWWTSTHHRIWPTGPDIITMIRVFGKVLDPVTFG